jgi:hypothetical protein
MSAPLTPALTAVDVEVFVRAWLLPIVTTSPAGAGVGSELWRPKAAPLTPMPLPYRAVRRITGPTTDYHDEPVVWVHTFGATYSAAAIAAGATDDRMRVLVEYPGWGTTVGGRVVHCDWVEIVAAAHEESYGAESVVTRFVSEYRLSLSLIPAS